MSAPETHNQRETKRRRVGLQPKPSAPALSVPLTQVLRKSRVDAPMMAYAQSVSSNNRHVSSQPIPLAPTSPIKRVRQEAIDQRVRQQPDVSMPEAERYQMEEEEEEDGEEDVAYDGTKPADPSMSEWLSTHRDDYLRAMLWREGRRGVVQHCSECDGARPATTRCRDCYAPALQCETCCAALHRHNPLHRVEKWRGAYFARYSLRECGLRVQFGHVDGAACPNPRRGRDDFVVMADNGIHEVAVDFCGCYQTPDLDFMQVLRAGWFPATSAAPRTCATLECLERFQTLSLHGKTSAYDFYASLETMTNGAGIKPPDRYKVFLRVVRQYRHLMLLKRGGRAHDRSGVWGTGQGELALRCPACPRPGVNLPEGWEQATAGEQFLYTIFLALDACFRLKRRIISSWQRDPGSGPGWAYMCEPFTYERFIATITEQDDARTVLSPVQLPLIVGQMSTCSGLAAVEQANTKFSRGYAATGVGMGVCARHEFVMPTSVADLQRGERYANMDYVFFSLLQHISHLLWVVLSYDIVCQWIKKLKERVKNLEPYIRITVIWNLVRFVIPKLHILGHVTLCRLLFSLLLLRGGAQTDGEGIERPWSMIGGVAGSTRSSGPGSRSDQLDCHWAFWNWRKMISLAALLRRRLDKAEVELAKQEESLAEFSKEQAADVPEWTRMVHESGKRIRKSLTRAQGLSERAVRELFEKQETEEEAAGVPRLHDVGATEFVVILLAVEDDQRRVRALADLKRSKSTANKINLRRERRKLNKKIARNVPILLPSALSVSQRANGGCRDGLVEIERKLRDAQCRSALASLRNQLHIKHRHLLHKKNHSRHQAAATRSRAVIARNENKILRHSDKYQMARKALVSLADGNEKAIVWPLLRKEDIRCLDDSDEGLWTLPEREDIFGGDQTTRTKVGESRRVVSWIWRFTGTAGTDEELRDAIRIEWSKAYARTRRWREEVRLLQEEWRRLPLSWAYEESVWEKRFNSVAALQRSEEEKDGLRAYAARQADTYRDLARRAEIIRVQPKLRRGAKRAREFAWVYRRDPEDATRITVQGGDVDAEVWNEGDDEARDEFIGDEPVDEYGNASDDDDDDGEFGH
ncbi:CxC2 domain-containing protein [Mycena kentingensis (nom. inval.)]|nr:CxC2 domain-containing protein [Mycena kentingensis (nom. inval.)]